MLKKEYYKIGTYLTSINRDGRLVIKIVSIDYEKESYGIKLIEGRLPICFFSHFALSTMEIATDYMREEKLRNLGI